MQGPPSETVSCVLQSVPFVPRSRTHLSGTISIREKQRISLQRGQIAKGQTERPINDQENRKRPHLPERQFEKEREQRKENVYRQFAKRTWRWPTCLCLSVHKPVLSGVRFMSEVGRFSCMVMRPRQVLLSTFKQLLWHETSLPGIYNAKNIV
jgi:hypothetical protein